MTNRPEFIKDTAGLFDMRTDWRVTGEEWLLLFFYAFFRRFCFKDKHNLHYVLADRFRRKRVIAMRNRQRPFFGIAVKMELIKRGMTSRELAGRIGIADSTLCDVLAGRNTSNKTKEKIAKALNLSRVQLETMEDAKPSFIPKE